VNDTELDWHVYNPGHLSAGSLGIFEPSGASVDLSVAELVFLPAVAVGRDGTRLGRGRGFYDRALASVAAPMVALVHNDEVFDTVPHEPHDVRVTAAITCSQRLELN
jgi:5-formyltetrahydrofolate cyclo-ligase